VRQSLDRVRVWVPNDYGDPFQVVMERFGASWKLNNVVFPDLRSDENYLPSAFRLKSARFDWHLGPVRHSNSLTA
jgi:hypothetical protein